MKCAFHPERSALGYCGTCGKPLCKTCIVRLRTGNFCESCASSPEGSTRQSAAPRRRFPRWAIVVAVLVILVLARAFIH